MPVFFLRPLPEFDVFQIDRGNRKLALELTVSRRHLDALDRRLYFAKTFSIERRGLKLIYWCSKIVFRKDSVFFLGFCDLMDVDILVLRATCLSKCCVKSPVF